MKHLVSALVLLLLTASAWAKVEMDSAQLTMKNSEQMAELIRTKIARAEKLQADAQDDESDEIVIDPEAVATLKAAMRLVLSRPDQDGSRGTLFSRVRRELNDMNATDQVLKELAEEAIQALKTEMVASNIQTTYVKLLENLMSEIKPDVKTNAVYKGIVENVRDAKIKLSDEVKTKSKLKTMKTPFSPSETAATILPKGK